MPESASVARRMGPRFRWGPIAVAVAAAGGLAGCRGSGGPPAVAPASALSAQAALGEQIFDDESLSASGRISCASCHDPAHAFAQPAAQAVPPGGADLDQAGRRNAPSLAYLRLTPPFHFDGEGTPTGGFDRDGRADSLTAQAMRPFLTDFEMANASVAEVSRKLGEAAYAAEFRAVYGDAVFEDPDRAFLAARNALAAYQLESPEFAPFTSKYDAFLAGRVELSRAELRGLALYNDPKKGNCAACHPSARGPSGEPPLFTDFTYDNLGVPRNADIPANDDPDYYDLGLCGPFRTDLTLHAGSVRRVQGTDSAQCRADGAVFPQRTLPDAARDRQLLRAPRYASGGVVSAGARWIAAQVRRLAGRHMRATSTRRKSPYNRHPGDIPALSESEIEDVVSFLETLTDGYQP